MLKKAATYLTKSDSSITIEIANLECLLDIKSVFLLEPLSHGLSCLLVLDYDFPEKEIFIQGRAVKRTPSRLCNELKFLCPKKPRIMLVLRHHCL